MTTVDCAICGNPLHKWVMVCDQCRQEYDLSSDWAQSLIASEKKWRNWLKKEDRNDTVVFSDYSETHNGITYTGWDLWMEGIPFKSRARFVHENKLSTLLSLCRVAELTESEKRALRAYLRGTKNPTKAKQRDAVQILSKMEGKTISDAAFRKRLSSIRQKLRAAARQWRFYRSI